MRKLITITMLIAAFLTLVMSGGSKAATENRQMYLKVWVKDVVDLYGYEIHISGVACLDKNVKATSTFSNMQESYEVVNKAGNNKIDYAATLLGNRRGVNGRIMLISVPVRQVIPKENIQIDILFANSQGKAIPVSNSGIAVEYEAE